MLRTCKTCDLIKDESEFHFQCKSKSKRFGTCKKCQHAKQKERNRKNTRKQFDKYLRKNYGITIEQYEEMERQQGGVCAICSEPQHVLDRFTGEVKRLCVDHLHVGEMDVRFLTCNLCNIAIGNMRDNPVYVMRLFAGLVFYNEPKKLQEICGFDVIFRDSTGRQIADCRFDERQPQGSSAIPFREFARLIGLVSDAEIQAKIDEKRNTRNHNGVIPRKKVDRYPVKMQHSTAA